MTDELAPSYPLAFRDVPWTWLDLNVGMAPIVLWRLTAMLIGPVELPAVWRWVVFAVSLLVGVWMVGYPWWRARRRGARFVGIGIGRSLLESALAIPLWLGALIVITIAGIGLAFSPSNNEPMGPFVEAGASKGRLIALFAFGIVLAPLTEEVFFRGMLYGGLRRLVHPALALLAQAAIFGAIHPYGATHSIAAGFLGFVLAAIYEWRGTLVTPIAVHVFQNAAAFTVAAVMAANAPLLGVTGDSRGDDRTIAQIVPGSSADEAGLRVGDVIVAIDDVSINSFNDLRAAIRRYRIGDVINVDYLRDGAPQRIEARLKGPPSHE